MNHRQPVPREVASHLQEMIRRGELAPDAQIPSQRTLSERLGVSRPSIREALQTLETLGLVRTFAGRGTFVVGPKTRTEADPAGAAATWRYSSEYRLADVFQSRRLIEGELCQLAALRISDAEVAALDAAAQEFREAWIAGDLVAHVDADLRFHGTVAAACPNRMLRDIYSSIQTLLTETQRQPLPMTASDRMQASIAEHFRIVDALRRRDGDAAAAEMRAHITHTAASADILLG